MLCVIAFLLYFHPSRSPFEETSRYTRGDCHHSESAEMAGFLFGV